MVQNYKKNLTYASKSKEKFTFFSLYKQISISKIFRCFFLVPHLHYLSPSSLSGTTIYFVLLFIFEMIDWTLLNDSTFLEFLGIF